MSKPTCPAAFVSLVLLLAAMPLLSGCQQTVDPLAAAMPYPPDLAITVFVDTPWVGDDDALTTRATYILLPNRRLHAAYGPGVTTQFFPPATATVSQATMAHLWQLIELFELRTIKGLDAREAATPARERIEIDMEQVEVDEEGASITDTVIAATRDLPMYRVQIIAHNRSHIYVIDQGTSMGTEFLIRELADLRGWTRRIDRPDGQEEPVTEPVQVEEVVQEEVDVAIESPEEVSETDAQETVSP